MRNNDRNGPDLPEPEPKSGEDRETSRRRAISDAMMQALEDDMDRRPDVYRLLADS